MTETYECLTCKKSVNVEHWEQVPTCRGKEMQKVDHEICLQPDHAEHSRPMDDEDACDDFRSG